MDHRLNQNETTSGWCPKDRPGSRLGRVPDYHTNQEDPDGTSEYNFWRAKKQSLPFITGMIISNMTRSIATLFRHLLFFLHFTHLL